MKKYLQLFALSWQNGFVYRTSLFMWRLRQFLTTVMAVTLWTTLFSGKEVLFGYQQSEMITYIFLVSIVQSFILATALQGLANTIYSGALSFDLVKPANVYFNLLAQDLADKSRNVFFVIIETLILFFLYKPVVTLPSITITSLFILWIIGGLMLHFFILLLFGSVGFWSPDTWGPRFLFYMFINFTAGRLFPLDTLPQTIQHIVAFTPFPYLSFWQIQLFLNKLTPEQVLQHSIVLSCWIAVAGLATKFVWKKGLYNYSAAGQ